MVGSIFPMQIKILRVFFLKTLPSDICLAQIKETSKNVLMVDYFGKTHFLALQIQPWFLWHWGRALIAQSVMYCTEYNKVAGSITGSNIILSED